MCTRRMATYRPSFTRVGELSVHNNHRTHTCVCVGVNHERGNSVLTATHVG